MTKTPLLEPSTFMKMLIMMLFTTNNPLELIDLLITLEDGLKFLLQPPQILTELSSTLMLLKPQLPLLLKKVPKLVELQPMLLPWLLNTKLLMTKTPQLELSTFMRMLPTTSFTTNGKLELIDLATTPEDGLKSLEMKALEMKAWTKPFTISLLTKAQMVPHLDLLKSQPPQILTEHFSMLMLPKLPLPLLLKKVQKLVEPLPMLPLWLLNTKLLMTKMLLPEPSTFMKMLTTMSFTTNSLLELIDLTTTLVDGLKLTLQEIELSTELD